MNQKILNKLEYFKKLTRYLKLSLSSPANNALALTFGFYIGIFPVFGTSTLLCMIPVLFFRLNPALVLVMNGLTTPVQLLLIYPFLKTGRILFFNDSRILPGISIQTWLSAETRDAALHIFETIIGGIAVWGVVSITTGYFLYKLFLKISCTVLEVINGN